MLLTLLCYFAINHFLTAATENGQASYLGYGADTNYPGVPNDQLRAIIANSQPVINMSTYIEKTENILRVPDMIKHFESTKTKIPKKSPKRTIQKIIKTSRSRKRVYLNQATSTTKPPLNGDELDKFYAQEEMMQKTENFTTSQANHNHNKRNRKTKVGRYPMPFKHMTSWKDHKRNKRSDDRKDVFIFTDFDEIEFLSEDKDKDVVNAHIKRYW